MAFRGQTGRAHTLIHGMRTLGCAPWWLFKPRAIPQAAVTGVGGSPARSRLTHGRGLHIGWGAPQWSLESLEALKGDCAA